MCIGESLGSIPLVETLNILFIGEASGLWIDLFSSFPLISMPSTFPQMMLICCGWNYNLWKLASYFKLLGPKMRKLARRDQVERNAAKFLGVC